ncbi:MAG: YeeE/YedE family protein [Thiotrichales bacterium]|nr:YeeE/YedE family protein [Thiotrichales bacterium]
MRQLSPSLFVLLLISPLLLFGVAQKFDQTLLYTATILWIGALLGATLNFFQYGFSSSFRSMILERRTVGMRAIIVLLGVAILLFAPLLAIENIGNQNFTGFIRTLSLAVPIGAFVFGIGMQIGCGCTSGTLNRVGQIQALSFTTLFFMVVGGTLAAFTFEHWSTLPAVEPFAFQLQFGWILGLIVQMLLLAGLFLFLKNLETKHHQHSSKKYQPLFIIRGKHIYSHSFFLAAISLAILNASLLLISGTPWSISSIFPYWGSGLIDLLKLPLDWTFWDYSMENATRMNQGPLENTVSLTTMGVLIGAFLVSLLRPRVKVSINRNRLIGSVLGGTVMGFGAVMASGCNIGAFFSGIASGSLHGWVWLVFALLGNILGLAIRKRLI